MSAQQQIETEFAAYTVENAKFNTGNAAAGTRARKHLAEMSKAIKLRRNEITAEKAARAAEKAASK